MADFSFCGTTLLLAIPEFEARVEGPASELADYINTISARLADAYRPRPGIEGLRDLIISVGPRGRCKNWLVSRTGSPDGSEATDVAAILNRIPVTLRVRRPILFCLTYSLGTANPTLSPEDLRLPGEWRRIAASLGKQALNTEELIEVLWSEPPRT